MGSVSVNRNRNNNNDDGDQHSTNAIRSAHRRTNRLIVFILCFFFFFGFVLFIFFFPCLNCVPRQFAKMHCINWKWTMHQYAMSKEKAQNEAPSHSGYTLNIVNTRNALSDIYSHTKYIRATYTAQTKNQ